MLLDLGFRIGAVDLLAQTLDLGLQIHGLEQLADGFGAHFGDEIVAVLLGCLMILLIGQRLAALKRGHAGSMITKDSK